MVIHVGSLELLSGDWNGDDTAALGVAGAIVAAVCGRAVSADMRVFRADGDRIFGIVSPVNPSMRTPSARVDLRMVV